MPNRRDRRAAASKARRAAPAIVASAPPAKPFNIVASGSALTIKAEKPEESKLGTFEGNAYTGASMRPEGWWEPVVIDLESVIIPSQHRPIFRQHDPEQLVGHTESVKADADGIHIAGVFSGEKQHTDKVTIPAKNGFQWQLSVGANPGRTERVEAGKTATVNGREITGPATISRDTVLGEISFVPLGADGDTSAAVAASATRKVMSMNKLILKAAMDAFRKAGDLKAAKYSDEEVDAMTEDEAKAAMKKCMAEEDDKGQDADEKKKEEEGAKSAGQQAITAAVSDYRKAIAAESKRAEAIRVACGGRYRDIEAKAIADGWTIEATKAALLDEVRKERPSNAVGVPGGLGYVVGTPTVTDEVLEAAALYACRHQFQLENDDFYMSPTPNGEGMIRRVPKHLQAETQRDMKARYGDQVRQTAHDLFANSRHQNYVGRFGPQLMISTALRASGHMSRIDLSSQSGVEAAFKAWQRADERIQAEGGSALSIGNILANVLNKFALQGYLFVEQAWREIAGIRPVNDFKPTKSINLLGQAMFKALGSQGELQNANFSDQAFANQAQPYGIIASIPWTHIVNDDLSMLSGIPTKIGQGAGLALNDYFWSLWSALTSGSVASAGSAGNINGVLPSSLNLNGDDGNAFFRTSSSTTKAAKQAGTAYLPNKATGAGTALGTAALQQGKALFDNQIDPNGNPLGFDGAMPILLHGPTLWQTANQLLYGDVLIAVGLSSTAAKEVQSSKNVFAGYARPVMSRYVESTSYNNSTTAWYLIMNPAALPVIECAFLNGVDTPAVLQAGPDFQFDRLGISIRGTMPFGVTQQNFRGAVYMAGA